jgi:hypothetical protein
MDDAGSESYLAQLGFRLQRVPWEWLWVGGIVVENGIPRVDGNGVPETRQCLLRLSQCEILDTWHTTGLRGTGSNWAAVAY